MNTLSWLIYLAEVADNLRGAFFIGIFTAGGLAFFLPPKGVRIFSGDHHHPGYGLGRTITWVVFGISLAGIVLSPSAKTIYMIAGSEAGETVVTSPDTQEMMGDLKAIIKKKLKEQLGE